MTKTEIHLLGLIMLYLSVRSLGYLGVGGGVLWTFPYGCSWLAPTLSIYSSVVQPPKVLTLARVSHPEPASGLYSQISNRPRPLPYLQPPARPKHKLLGPSPVSKPPRGLSPGFYLLQAAILPAMALHCLSLGTGTFRDCRIGPSPKKSP